MIKVESVDLAEIINNVAKTGALIDLKLDIEGAEYIVIDRLIKSGAVQHISTFFCEFHWDRIGMEEKEHIRIVEDLNNTLRTPIKDSDACDWMMAHLHGKNKSEMGRIRAKALTKIYLKRIFPAILFNRP